MGIYSCALTGGNSDLGSIWRDRWPFISYILIAAYPALTYDVRIRVEKFFTLVSEVLVTEDRKLTAEQQDEDTTFYAFNALYSYTVALLSTGHALETAISKFTRTHTRDHTHTHIYIHTHTDIYMLLVCSGSQGRGSLQQR